MRSLYCGQPAGPVRGGHTGAMSRWRWWPIRPQPPLHIAEDEGSGPAAVLLHGVASSSMTYENVVPKLSDSHRVVVPDLLGFGGSVAPADATFSLREHVAAVRDTITALGLKVPVTIAGHSLGALIAIRLAAEYPRLVKHLVVISPPVYLPKDAVIDPVERARVDGYLKLYHFMRDNPGFTRAAAVALEALTPTKNYVELDEHNWEAFAKSLEQCVESQTTLTDLAQVRCTIDLVYGTLDPFLSPSGLRAMERMRGVATTRVEGVDHPIRPKMAQVVARLIATPSPPTAPIRLVAPD